MGGLGTAGSAPGRGQLVHRRRGEVTACLSPACGGGKLGTVGLCGRVHRKGWPVVSVLDRLHSPWSRALPASPSPGPSPGEAWPAPPAPGSGQARGGRAVRLRTEEAPGRPGLQGGLGPRGQGWGVVGRRKSQESQEVVQPSQRQAPRPHSSQAVQPWDSTEHAYAGGNPWA